jgi:hypothetical protein
MMLETVLFTALPTRRAGADLYFSVLVSPQLGGKEGAPARHELSLYPDFRGGTWAEIVRAIDWQLALRWSVDDRDEQYFDARRISADPDPELFATLFPGSMPVDPFAVGDPGSIPILSSPQGYLSRALDDVQLRLARSSPDQRPLHIDLVSAKSGAGRVLDGFVIDPATRVQLDATVDRQLVENKATVAPRNLDASGTRLAVQMLNRMLAPTATEEQMAEALTWPDLDFHAALSLLQSHPNLLRRLGLLVDLVAPVSRLRRESGDVRVFPGTSWPPVYDPDVVGVDITTAYPRVLTSLAPSLFRPKPRTAALTADGFASTGDVIAVTSNVESEVIAHQSLATGLVRMFRDERESFGTPESGGTPARHSGGIELVRTDFASALHKLLEVVGDNRGLQDVGDEVNLSAEDLLIGHRVDVRRKGSRTWLSLHRRRGTLTPYRGKDARASIDLGEDEGWAEPAATSAVGESLTQWRVRESLAAWTGWSLSLPQPGRSLTPDNAAGDAPTADEALAVISTLHGSIDYSAPAGGARLPSLRFSDVPYEMRLRWVDVGGNSVAPDKAGGSILEVPYMRHDPVASPAAYLGEEPVWGESVSVVVLRTGNMANSRRMASDRWLAAPQVSAALCLTHGVFDDAQGRPDAGAYEVIASRETAALVGGTTADVLTDPPRTVPYLPDPIAEGLYLRGLPTNGDVYDGEYSLAYGGSWPAREISRVRFSGSEPNGARLSGGQLIIGLVPGRVAHLRVSNALTADGLKVMDLWRRVQAAGFGNQAAARKGAWWQLTPDRLIVVVHAVQRPLSSPKFVAAGGGAWTSTRRPGESSAEVEGTLRLDQPSTESVDIVASRTFGVDAGPGAEPPRVAVNVPMGVIGTSPVPDPGPGGRVEDRPVPMSVRAPLPDTRRESLLVTATAKSRFAEYFRLSRKVVSSSDPVVLNGGQPVADGSLRVTYDEGGSTTTVSDAAYTLDPESGTFILRSDADPASAVPVGVDLVVSYIPGPIDRSSKAAGVPAGQQAARIAVPSSARPLPPVVEQILPAFAWTNPGGANKSERSGGTLRLYLARPWFSSGIDEDLAIVLLPQGRREVIEARDALVTQWGLDPVMAGSPLPTSGHPGFPTRSDFAGGTFTPDQRLAEFDAPVDVLRYQVGSYSADGAVSGFDAERDLWFVDITMKPGSAYRPFVRLALARYQDRSVGGLKLSPVSLVDVVQLEPKRSAGVAVAAPARGATKTRASVTLTGPSYIRNTVGAGPGRVYAIVEEYEGPTGPKVDPRSVAAWTEKSRSTLAGRINATTGIATWTGGVTVPARRERGRYRIVLEEYELHRIDGSSRPLPESADAREALLGERLVHQDIIEI